jgi:assimilatory nitrate reductase catalytic subunit
VRSLWGVRASRHGRQDRVELFDALAQAVGMVWIACTNPAHSMPDATACAGACARGVRRVQDASATRRSATTPTCSCPRELGGARRHGDEFGAAHLAAARRVTPPGEAKPTGASRWSSPGAWAAKSSSPIETPETIFDEHRETTRGRDLDITGLSYALLEKRGPQQWPYVDKARARLYEDGVFPTPSGRARFVATEYVPPAESTDADFPLRLTTGRLRDQWHTMSRSGLVAQLFSHNPEPEIDSA